MVRRPTATSAFGVSRRESHDASAFYRRFTAPAISSDSDVATHRSVDELLVGDARRMAEIGDASVALVVTSPPYFAGKEYEKSLGQGGVPATYLEYLQLLRDVFAECLRTLEPGGRLAVNVANLGRRPYRSLSADVIGILQDDLRMLLRGEIIWAKQKGLTGSCAWGSFQQPGNPVLRDLTERVIVASKGRFDRAVPRRARARSGLPSESSLTRDDFMENTLDVWDIAAESATRVGHPAPFPVELPARLIELYTYRGDLVLDPFVGSGTTAVAAVRTGRHFAGYDVDPTYIDLARDRVEDERRRPLPDRRAARLPDPAAGAVRQGRGAKQIAHAALAAAGFTDIRNGRRQAGGVVVDFTAADGGGRLWLFDVVGGFTTYRGGMGRADLFWKALGRAAVLREATDAQLVWLTTGVPAGGPVAGALTQVTGTGKPVFAVFDILDPSDIAALSELAADPR
jgi:DNA modification methylase